MSFFDEGDEPRTTRQPPAASACSRASSVLVGGSAGQQTLRVRQGVAALRHPARVVLLVVGVKCCRDSAHENALKRLQPRGRHDRAGVRRAGRQAALRARSTQQALQPVDQQARSTSCASGPSSRRSGRATSTSPATWTARRRTCCSRSTSARDARPKIARASSRRRGDQEGAAEAGGRPDHRRRCRRSSRPTSSTPSGSSRSSTRRSPTTTSAGSASSAAAVHGRPDLARPRHRSPAGSAPPRAAARPPTSRSRPAATATA